MNMLEALKNTLHKIAQENPDTYFVYCDAFGNILFDDFTDIPKERIIPCGISESTAVGISAGLALGGKKVFLLYSAIFLTTRALEQIRDDIAYNCANVTIIGFQAGLNLSNPKNGYSHWAIDDINNLRTMPNIEIVNVSTIDELEYFLKSGIKSKKPLYLRLEEHLSTEKLLNHEKIKFGEFEEIVSGNDGVIITTGSMLEFAKQFVMSLNRQNIYPAIYNVNTIKPFNYEALDKILKLNVPIVTFENHGIGGLGSIVGEYIAQSGKGVLFYPYRIDNEADMAVVGDLNFVKEKLFKNEESIKNAYELFNYKIKCSAIYRKVCVVTHTLEIVEKFFIFNCLVLSRIKREKVKKHKLKYKYFIFGKYRII